uniref:Olfactory receptor family 1 subfamily J member 2 n=1 Tax=Rhinopithecus roxellana TaxID=61622 RepID=A0A2K6P698_RHIRO
MSPENQSSVSEFLLLGLPIRPEQAMFFAVFLTTVLYLTKVLGNLLIIMLIWLDSNLHTLMYFFLSHLALTDISFSSVTVPKMLMDMWTKYKLILYEECISQMEELCVFLVAVSWILSCASSLSHTLLLTHLSFCAANTIPYIFCDLAVLLKLFLNELVMFTVGVVVITLPFMFILVSYGYIGATILRVPSTKEIQKALSTCASHLSVVSLYYGSIFGHSSIDKDVTVALMYTVVTPMLNSFIYSLRNRDVKEALGKLFNRATFFSW